MVKYENVARLITQIPGVFGIFEKPIILVSRRVSPYYIKCEGLASDGYGIQAITSAFVREVCEGRFPDKITTSEARGILFASPVGDRIGVGATYVRKKEKAYGAPGKIVGRMEMDEYVVGIDDLVTTATSAENVIEAVRGNGSMIDRYLVVFDRNEGSRQALQGMEGGPVELNSLACMDEHFLGFLSPEQRKVLEPYVPDPLGWSRRYLERHPVFIRDVIGKVVKDGKVTDTAPFEVFTKAHPELQDEYRERIMKWLEELHCEEGVDDIWARLEAAKTE